MYHIISERMLNELVERDHIDTVFHKFSIIQRTINGVTKLDKYEQIKVKEITEEGYLFTLVFNIDNEHEANFNMYYSFSVVENLKPGPGMVTKEYHSNIPDEIRSESGTKDKYYPLVKRIRHIIGTLI